MSLRVALPVAIAVGAAVLVPPASAANIAPPGARATDVSVAGGPGGRALVLWRAARAGVREIQASALSGDRFGAAETVLSSPAVIGAPFGWIDAGGRPRVLVPTGPLGPTALLEPSPPGAAAGFGAPVAVAPSVFDTAAANGAGDAAFSTHEAGRLRLYTARRAEPFDAGQAIAAGGEVVSPAPVAIGPRGELAVAYSDPASNVVVRRGAVGAPLGPPEMAGRIGEHIGLAVAVDDAGVVTVAFAAPAPGGADALTVVRGAPGAGLGPARTLDRNRAGILAQLAAAGRTTAITWTGSGFPDHVHLAVARGAGRFAPVRAPLTRAVPRDGDVSLAEAPGVAVDVAGDLLLTWRYGPFGAIHATMRRAGASRFGAPRVLTGLRIVAATSAAALLGDRRPLVVYGSDHGLDAVTELGARTVDLRPPGLKLTRVSARELRRRGTVTINARCSEACVMNARARLTTGRAPAGGPGQAIEQPSLPARVVPTRVRRIRFALSPVARAALARTGRAQVKISVTVANATGAARTARRSLEIGRR